MRFAIKYTLIVIVAIALIAVGINLWVLSYGNDRIYTDLEDLEPRYVGLVLGTSSSPDGVRVNAYFEERMEAAIRLYESGKVKHLLVSGDNSSSHYNEPRDMANYLVARGIPADQITLDYAGFRTYDSLLRGKEIFGLEDCIVITQRFHAPRALFVGAKKGIDVQSYVANDPEQGVSFSLRVREWMARIVAAIDVVTNRQPKFYGQKEFIDRSDV